MADLALFDLDMTLLDVDSDHSWGCFIVEAGLVDAQVYAEANNRFYQDYIAGRLDAVAYNEFVAAFLKTQTPNQLCQYRQQYLERYIRPNMRPKAMQAMNAHRQKGDTVVVISATNDFVVESVARLFGVDSEHTLATRLKCIDGCYTGKLAGEPNFKTGKIKHLDEFIAKKRQQGIVFERLIAYSDSKNDLPLLHHADEAICITPDDVLRQVATEQGWQVLDWSL